MPVSSAQKQIESLRKKIEEHNYHYYVLDSPVISDEEYDRLFAELIHLEREHPECHSPFSPTQKVGGKPLDKFTKVKHSQPMLSLQNVYNEEEFSAFYKRWEDTLSSPFEVFGEPKFDGLAVELVYENGGLVTASTRGDGVVS